MVNSGLLTVAEDSVTLEPDAPSVALMLLFWPTTTLPKSRLAGLSVKRPLAVAVPDSEISTVVFDAFDATVIAPFTLPAAFGANAVWNV